jgi:hypothetical protein
VIAERLGRSTDWLLADAAAASPRPSRLLKVKGYVGATGEAHYYDMPEQDLDEIRAWDDDPPTAVAVQIRGQSLGRLLDRWYAVYDEVRRPITPDLIGEVCVVGLADGRVLIKQIQKVGDGFDLLSNRDRDPPIKNAQIEWAAKVKNIRAR